MGNGGHGQWWEAEWTCGAAHTGTSYPFTYTGAWSSSVGTPTSINTGVVNTSGTAVTWVSGSLFNLNWTGSIYINDVAYTISSVTSTTSITLTGSAGTQTAVAYMLNPMLCSTGFRNYTTAGTACSTSAQCTISPYLYCTAGVYREGPVPQMPLNPAPALVPRRIRGRAFPLVVRMFLTAAPLLPLATSAPAFKVHPDHLAPP